MARMVGVAVEEGPTVRRKRRGCQARRSAVFGRQLYTYSLQGVEPWAYLSDVLQRFANAADPATLAPRGWRTARPSVALA